ncbi:MAG: hypothetical protein H7039_16410 [Bryobacteraceae bacterium]|nr:hypothetical protein [Bryobacteraceae bacterium]
MANGHLEQLIIDMKESLEREIKAFREEFHDFRSDITSRFEAQAARLDRHAGLWQTGSRWSGRMDVWAEKIDANSDTTNKLLAEQREQIHELADRVKQLERRLNGQIG